MKKMTHRYQAGDLVVVGDHAPTQWVPGNTVAGPREVGRITAKHSLLKAGDSFLVLKDSTNASWRYNKKLYVEVLTPEGPRLIWASYFRKRGQDE